METNNYIVHEGRIGVPDPAFPFPYKHDYYTTNKGYREDLIKKALDICLLHTAWFADEEQNTARYRIWCSEYFVPEPKTPKERYEEYKLKDGLYTVPDMPEWEKQKEFRVIQSNNGILTSWTSDNSDEVFEDVSHTEYRTIVRFVKEKEPKQS